MASATTDDNATDRRRLHELIEGFDTAMLVTRNDDDELRSRPMALADVDDDETLYFATSVESGKIDEIVRTPRVNVAFQDGSTAVSVSGYARVLDDPRLVEDLWNPAWKVWFPDGPEDDSLVLLEIAPTTAEYWHRSLTDQVTNLFEFGRALVTGAKVDPSELGEHETVEMN